MKKLIKFLGSSNVILSVLENGDSYDKSAQLLNEFRIYLDGQKILNKIVTTKILERDNRDRISWLVELRNHALDFLYEQPKLNFNKTRILFFNDIIYTYQDIIKLINTNDQDYDAVCGMDYYTNFYDIWVAIGIDGKPFRQWFPFFRNKVAQDIYINGETLRTFSCWNGIMALKAKPLENRKIFFRYSDRGLQSECTLFCADLWNTGHRKILVNTQLKFAYQYHFYYMNKFFYPWCKFEFAYFYYYFKFIFVMNNYNIANLESNDIQMDDDLYDLNEILKKD